VKNIATSRAASGLNYVSRERATRAGAGNNLAVNGQKSLRFAHNVLAIDSPTLATLGLA